MAAMTAPGPLSVQDTRAPDRSRSAVAGWLLVQVTEGARPSVAAALSRIPGVVGWQETTGSYDFIVEIAGADPGPLAAMNAVRAVPDVGHVVCCRPSYGGDAVVLP